MIQNTLVGAAGTIHFTFTAIQVWKNYYNVVELLGNQSTLVFARILALCNTWHPLTIIVR